MLMLASAFFSSQTERIVSLAARARLPPMYEHRDFVEPGGLMSAPCPTRPRCAGAAVAATP